MARKKKQSRDEISQNKKTEGRTHEERTEDASKGTSKNDNVILMGAAGSFGEGEVEREKGDRSFDDYITEEFSSPPLEETGADKKNQPEEKKEEVSQQLPIEIEEDTEDPLERHYNLGKLFLGLVALLFLSLFFGNLFGWFGPVDIHYSIFWPLLLLFVGFSLFRVTHKGRRAMAGIAIVVLVFLIATGLLMKGGAVASVLVSGTVVEEERSVPPFSHLMFKGLGNITVIQGEETGILVEADENILSHVITKVENETLVVGYENSFWNLFLFEETETDITITTPSLEDISFAGTGSLKGSDISGESLKIFLSGEGTIVLEDIDVMHITTRLSGTGDVSVSGKALRELVYISGKGTYEGESLVSDETGVRISGTGDAVVQTTLELNVGITGSGAVIYIGEPRITESVMSGSGSIKEHEAQE